MRKTSKTKHINPENSALWIQGKYYLNYNSEFRTNKRNKDNIVSSYYYCSNCGNEAFWDTDYGQQLFQYCPYCGSYMREYVCPVD